MRIIIDLPQRSIELTEPAVFDRFSAEVTGDGPTEDRADLAELTALVQESGVGRLHSDGDHVVVDPQWLRQQAGAAIDAGGVTTADWEAGFETMCAYAAGKGWVENDGGILAHIEHPA